MRDGGFTARYKQGHAWLTNACLIVLGYALVMMARQFVAEYDHFSIGFANDAMLSIATYLAAVLIVRTQPVNRATYGILIGFAVAMHLMTYFADPNNSSDIYRYVWDGIVQHVHISPYRYVPGDKALTFLRAPNQEIYDNINRRDYARTIYPPVAQMMYWLATFFSPDLAAMKLMMLGFEALTAGAVMTILRRMGRPREEALMILWCPLLVWEIGGAGHVDAVILGFVALALVFRLKNKPALTGLFLGLAIMTKFYPLVLFPALYQRRDWRMPAVVAAVCATGYAIYSSVGWLVLGFLGGYTKEEGMESGTRYFFLDFAHQRMGMPGLPNAAFYLLCAVVMGGIAVWAWRNATVERFATAGPLPQVPAVLKASAMMAFAMMLLFSPHYPWYVLWLVPLFTLVPNLPMVVYVMGLFFGLTTGLAMPGPKMFLMNERLYGAVAVAAVLHFVLRRWPVLPYLVSRERVEENRELADRERALEPVH